MRDSERALLDSDREGPSARRFTSWNPGSDETRRTAPMQANVGVAMGSGTDVARESADVLLLGNDLRRLVETLRIARRCRRIIMQNFVGTLSVDGAGVALAAFGLLNPLLAAFIHVTSELAFILNSTRLLPARARHEHAATPDSDATLGSDGQERVASTSVAGASPATTSSGSATRPSGTCSQKMVTPAMRREVVGYVQQTYSLSERSACRALGVSRASHRYKSTRPSTDPLTAKLRRIAAERPRFGYRRLCVLLRRRGEAVNHKRVYRLYRLEGLAVRVKRRKRLAASPRATPRPPRRPGERWSMDFVFDRTGGGIGFRVLTVTRL